MQMGYLLSGSFYVVVGRASEGCHTTVYDLLHGSDDRRDAAAQDPCILPTMMDHDHDKLAT